MIIKKFNENLNYKSLETDMKKNHERTEYALYTYEFKDDEDIEYIILYENDNLDSCVKKCMELLKEIESITYKDFFIKKEYTNIEIIKGDELNLLLKQKKFNV